MGCSDKSWHPTGCSLLYYLTNKYPWTLQLIKANLGLTVLEIIHQFMELHLSYLLVFNLMSNYYRNTRAGYQSRLLCKRNSPVTDICRLKHCERNEILVAELGSSSTFEQYTYFPSKHIFVFTHCLFVMEPLIVKVCPEWSFCKTWLNQASIFVTASQNSEWEVLVVKNMEPKGVTKYIFEYSDILL